MSDEQARPMDTPNSVPDVPDGTHTHHITCDCGAYWTAETGWSHAHHAPDDQPVSAELRRLAAESEGTWPPG